MDELRKELEFLNKNLQRLVDLLMPFSDPGMFGKFRAFKVFLTARGFGIRGIEQPDPITFEELIGVDGLISGLKSNTTQFLKGLPCNNVLAYGPRGIGKSSAIKALLNKYHRRGLRMVEMPKETLCHILDISEMIRHRSEKFIVFCDDLSFDEDDTSYRQIKTILEGGLEMKPGNLLIYATSNRRHLMPERPQDNLPVYSEGELHPADAVEEKLSLSDRFGIRLGVHNFDSDIYLEIVSNYVKLRGIRLRPAEVKNRAMEWSLFHGSYSGRTARQFVDDLQGRLRIGKRHE